MTDTYRLVLLCRAILVVVVLLLVVTVAQGKTGGELSTGTIAELGAAGAAIVYALRSLIPGAKPPTDNGGTNVD